MLHVPACLDRTIAVASTDFLGIHFYQGKIRSGKSHHVVRTAITDALRQGRHVYTNVDFGGPLTIAGVEVLSEEQRAGLVFSQYLNKKVDHLFHIRSGRWIKTNLVLGESEDSTFNAVPRGSRIVVDEVQNVFPVDQYRTNPVGFFRFLTKCGHYDVDFVFMTQNYKLVDSRIYSTASTVFTLKAASVISSLFSRAYIVKRQQSVFDYEGLGSEKFLYDQDVFKLYKSADVVVKHRFFAGPAFVLVPLALFFGSIVLYMSPAFDNAYFFGKRYKSHSSTVAQSQVSSQILQKVVPPAVVPAPPRYSATEDVINKLAALKSNDVLRDSVRESSSTVDSDRPIKWVFPRSNVSKSLQRGFSWSN